MNKEYKKALDALESKNIQVGDTVTYDDGRIRFIGLVIVDTLHKLGKSVGITDYIIVEDKNVSPYYLSIFPLNERKINEYVYKPSEEDLNFKIISEID